MRTHARIVLIVAIGVAAFLPSAATVHAQATVTEFTGTEGPCAVVYPGTWTYPDGNIHIRGLILSCTETSDTPLYGGQNTIFLDANLRADSEAFFLGGVGPIWGTWQMGDWAGTWEGKAVGDGAVYHADGSGTGPHGRIKLRLIGDHGALSGRILDPQGDQ